MRQDWWEGNMGMESGGRSREEWVLNVINGAREDEGELRKVVERDSSARTVG